MNRKICVLYGLNEGPLMGRLFTAACQDAGFSVVRSPAEADIIVAHSGGCFLVPAQHRAQLVILIGLPYWPGGSWLSCTIVKVRREFQLYRKQHRLQRWLCKWTYHFRYALNLKAGLQMAQNLDLESAWNSPQHQVLIRNRYDVYCLPGVLDVPFKGPRTFISLPGEHDDCWDNPKPYLNLIQSLL